MERPAGARTVLVMTKPMRVAVVGGGIAAAEVLLALRALAEDRVELELVTPDTRLPLRAASPAAAPGAGVPVYDLEALAADAGARLRVDTAEAVAAGAHRVRLASGAVTGYDALVLAVGARARAAIPGASTYRDHRDANVVHHLGDADVAFAVPAGAAWSVPVYELALVTSAQRGRTGTTTVVTPEHRPLEVFGTRAGERVGALLAERGIAFRGGSVPAQATPGRLRLSSGDAVPADQVIAVPRLVGRRLAGVPAGWDGFVATDECGEVLERAGVFAIGDVAAFPVKQGGLAAQQADVVAATLAARAGAVVEVPPLRHVLRTVLLAAGEPLFLRAELGRDGTPVPSSHGFDAEADAPWWPPAKVFGRHLSPWMAAQDRAAIAAPA
jgi:sulfide:quinone oxidoreductase